MEQAFWRWLVQMGRLLAGMVLLSACAAAPAQPARSPSTPPAPAATGTPFPVFPPPHLTPQAGPYQPPIGIFVDAQQVLGDLTVPAYQEGPAFGTVQVASSCSEAGLIVTAGVRVDGTVTVLVENHNATVEETPVIIQPEVTCRKLELWRAQPGQVMTSVDHLEFNNGDRLPFPPQTLTLLLLPPP
jgi:hypothetical protein